MNAADLYRKAFARLPEETLDAISRHRSHDDPDAERFFERGHDALDLLHQAVRCAQCDWDEEAGTTIPATDFSGGRRLALLALLRSERSFRRGDDRAGLEDLAAVMTLGRHLGQNKYVSGLIVFPIEDTAATNAFEVVGRLDSESCRAFAERLDALPAFRDLPDALRAEKAYIRATYYDMFATQDDGDVSPLIRTLFAPAATTDGSPDQIEGFPPAGEMAERILLASGGARSGMLALAGEVLAALDTLAEIAERGEDASGKLSTLRNAALSNPLLADELRTFDIVRPLWQLYKERFTPAFARLLDARLSVADAPDFEHH